MYLLDTNIIIGFLKRAYSADAMEYLGNIIDEQSNISVITKMEALGFNFKTEAEQSLIEIFIGSSSVLEITDDVVNHTIALRKNGKIQLPDAIISATALSYGFTLITGNISDFKNIKGLNIIDPYHL